MARPGLFFAGCAAIAASILGGCSHSLVATSADDPAPKSATPVRAAHDTSPQAIAKSMAEVALDDHDLSEIRGGLNVGSGVVVNFAFQQATFVNGTLVQNVVTPTITVSPGSGAAIVAGNIVSGAATGFSPNSVATVSNSAAQIVANAPALSIQSMVNNGMTSILSNLSSNGSVSSVINNSASNQLVQQFINANIDVTGLSNTIQQSVASSLVSRVQAATSQFR